MVRAILACAIVVLPAACGPATVPYSTPAFGAAGADIDAPAGHFRLLHAFTNSPDGARPVAGLTQLNGTLYGVTPEGGASYGTVFSLSVTGKEKILHNFTGSDGGGPVGTLLAYDGTLYGTTPGGQNDEGEVFSITESGDLNILHTFSEPDGTNPESGLIESGGVLYGTTSQGGEYSQGTVYAIDASGYEHIVYSFESYSGDGRNPIAALTFWKGKLYGTTPDGGTDNYGTVFSVTLDGKETVLHSFAGSPDGKNPIRSNLAQLGNALYGTTSEGGTHGKGVVFKVLPSGSVQTVYDFGDVRPDGVFPETGVVAYKNALYGTTVGGGTTKGGTVFRVTRSGRETVLGSFVHKQGAEPESQLLPVGSNLYGTMSSGGEHNNGTAFRFTP
jgi:uncharacterized repeat protein (TIGR03803 family)